MIGRARQIAYLRAMGIEVWVPRTRTDAAAVVGSQPESLLAAVPSSGAGFTLGPGTGSLLLLCDSPREAALPIAADIARCFAGAPVWGWPARDAGGVPLERAIRDRLFTGVLVFGACLEASAASAEAQVCGSALIVRADALPDLARDPAARRALWSALRATGWCVSRQGEAGGRQ